MDDGEVETGVAAGDDMFLIEVNIFIKLQGCI